MTELEISVLERRYRRTIHFDRGLWVFYAITAFLPGYYLFAFPHARIFHATGVVMILAVSCFGWIVNTRLLSDRLRTEGIAFGVTGAFVISRMVLAALGVYVFQSQFYGFIGGPPPPNEYWRGLAEFLMAPSVTYLLFFVGCYRLVYHLAVHFLLKIQELKQEPTESPLPMPRPVTPPASAGGAPTSSVADL